MGRAGKIVSILKILFYLFVIIGVVVYAVDLYSTRGEWRAEIVEPPQVSLESTSQLRVTATVRIYNPSHSTVQAKLIWYNIYVDGQYVGQGFIPYLKLKPGNNTLKVSTTINLASLPCTAITALEDNGSINVSVSGYLIATIELYGKLGYRDVTVPFNTTVYTVQTPRLTGPARDYLKILGLACKSPSTLWSIIEKTVEAGNVTGGGLQIPFP